MKDDKKSHSDQPSGLTRRDFMKISGISAAVPLVLGPTVVYAAGEEVVVHGPGKVSVVLNVNGNKLTAELEPRVTLLEALRNNFDLTGAKSVCDRGTCGACTVLMDGKPVYACSVLAIEAQGKKITTVEGLTEGELANADYASLCRPRCAAVRFLHPGIYHRHHALSSRASQRHRGRYSPWLERQLLPLRHLQRNSRRRPCEIGHGEGRCRMSELHLADPGEPSSARQEEFRVSMGR